MTFWDKEETMNNRVSVGIFATAGVSATRNFVIYVDIHILWMFSFVLADLGQLLFGKLIGFHLMFVLKISKV
jgi:hypothetical protein